MLQYAWALLILAGITEVIWAFFMKQSNGFTKILPTVLFLVFSAVSLILLTLATKYIPIGVAYPVWVAIGVVGAVLSGVVFFNESISVLKVVFVLIILIGVIGLKIT